MPCCRSGGGGTRNKMFFSSLRSEKNRKAVVANSKSNTDLGGTIDGIVNPELLTGDGNFVQLLLPDAERADAEEWWNAVPGFEQFGANKPLSREQRRTANQRARDVLAARVAPEFEADPRLLSQQTLRALGIAINRYQAIVAAGGWPTIPDKVTLRLNDSGENVSKGPPPSPARRRLAGRNGAGLEFRYRLGDGTCPLSASATG